MHLEHSCFSLLEVSLEPYNPLPTPDSNDELYLFYSWNDFYFFLFKDSARVWTQGFAHVRKMLHNLSHSTSLFKLILIKVALSYRAYAFLAFFKYFILNVHSYQYKYFCLWEDYTICSLFTNGFWVINDIIPYNAEE
jgi:hypothetical protein